MAGNSNGTQKGHKYAGNHWFNEMVGEFERSSGNAGVRPETHTAGLPGLLLGSSLPAGAEQTRSLPLAPGLREGKGGGMGSARAQAQTILVATSV